MAMQSEAQPDQSETVRRWQRVRWAMRAALALGITASLSANVLHAQPNSIARVIAAWPPIALLVAVETLGRAPIRQRLNWVRIVAMVAIAGIAAWVSYWHMAGVAHRYGEDRVSAHLLPLSVDGLILIASVTLVDLTARIRSSVPGRHSIAVAPPIPSADGEAKPKVSLTKPPAQPEPQPEDQQGVEDVAETPEQRRSYALAQLMSGAWTVEQAAAHAGISVRRLQQWADEAAARTRKPRGGPRKAQPEPKPPVEIDRPAEETEPASELDVASVG